MTVYVEGYDETSGARHRILIAIEDIDAAPAAVFFYGFRLLPLGIRHERRIAITDLLNQDSDIYLLAYRISPGGQRHEIQISALTLGEGGLLTILLENEDFLFLENDNFILLE